jgi:hypothetical protein
MAVDIKKISVRLETDRADAPSCDEGHGKNGLGDFPKGERE